MSDPSFFFLTASVINERLIMQLNEATHNQCQEPFELISFRRLCNVLVIYALYIYMAY